MEPQRDALHPDELTAHRARYERLFPYALAVIVFFSLATKIYRLDEPPKYYFDEVYYAFTAEQTALLNRKVYDPHAASPKGVAYEWTHPPLSKLIIAAAIDAFGPTSFGWRISSAVFGSGIVLLTGLLCYSLFHSYSAALLAALLASFDGLLFVQSRIAMCDVHLVFFMLAAVLGYVRWRADRERILPLFIAGAGIGGAVSVKWSAVYVCAAIGVDLLYLLVRRRMPGNNWLLWFALAFAALPAAMYGASHALFFAMGYDLGDFVELQRQMFYYHSNLKATHKYQSTPLQWMFNLNPTWMYVDYSVKGRLANIYNLGNHVVLYGGLLAAVFCGVQLVRTRQWQFWILLLCYLMFWAPWVLSPRIAFFHHYTPAVPLLAIMLGYALVRRAAYTGKPYLAINTVLAAGLWLALFYPFLSGLHLPKSTAELLYYVLEKPS